MWFSAAQITIVGMTVTFVFLIIMVCLITLLGFIVPKFFPEPLAKPIPEEEVNDVLIAAVAAALTGARQ